MHNENLKISVVIPTAGATSRRTSLLNVIDSILQQDLKVFEIILVWQAEEDIAFFSKLDASVRVVIQEEKALSMAKNNGVKNSVGDMVLFLDDDTTFNSCESLSFALDVMSKNQYDFIIANVCCESKLKPVAPIDKTIQIDTTTLRGNFWEPGMLISKSLFERFKFDESLGIGCLHGASEGFDLGARLIKSGCRGVRLHDYVLNHPPLNQSNSSNVSRIFWYSMGNGIALISNGYYKWYLLDLCKALIKLTFAVAKFDKIGVRSQAIRFLCLLLGPIVPKGRPI